MSSSFYIPRKNIVAQDYDDYVMDSEPGAWGGPIPTPHTMDSEPGAWGGPSPVDVFKPKTVKEIEGDIPGWLKTAGEIAKAITPAIQRYAAEKRGYQASPFPGDDSHRKAGQIFMRQMLEAQRERNDQIREQARKDRIDAFKLAELGSLIRGAISRGEITSAQGAEALETGVFPDLTKPIAPLEDFDYSAYGLEGFGLEDLRAGLEQGYTLGQLKEIARKAPGGRIGGGARKVFGFPETGLPST
jgi:hypothetical protein